jgi:hypothetical protein
MATQSSEGAQASAIARAQTREAHGGKHVHHGRTPAAWTGVTFAMLGFLLGGFAMVDGPNWVLFWIAAALVAIGVIAAKVMQALGHGAS